MMTVDKYLSDYRDLINSHINLMSQKDAGSYGCFWPQPGRSALQGGLMVIGRATNGWGNHIDSNSMSKHSDSCESIETHMTNARNEMTLSGIEHTTKWAEEAWLNPDPNSGYRTSRSQFWCAVKVMLDEMFGPNENLNTEYLLWSNLLKLAPATEGNPHNWSWDLQLQPSAELILKEIEIFKPKAIIFMTGMDWFLPFAYQWHDKTKDVRFHEQPVQCSGLLEHVPFAVGFHPQSRHVKNKQAYAQELIATIRSRFSST